MPPLAKPQKQSTAVDPELFLVKNYTDLMGCLVQRRLMLGLADQDIDELGGFAHGYIETMFRGGPRIGLDKIGAVLAALKVHIIVAPVEMLSDTKFKLRAPHFREFSEADRIYFREIGRRGGIKRKQMNGPRKRRKIARMGGLALAEKRRLRKAGLEPIVKAASPAIMRKLERRPAKNEKRPPSMSMPSTGSLRSRDPAPGRVENRDFSVSLDPFDLGKP